MKESTHVYKPKDLELIKTKYNKNMSTYDYEALVCSGAGCISSDCGKVMDALVESIEANNLQEKVVVKQTGRMGTCDIGPVIIVMPKEVFYTKLDPEDIPEIVKKHFIEGSILERKTYYDKINKKHV